MSEIQSQVRVPLPRVEHEQVRSTSSNPRGNIVTAHTGSSPPPIKPSINVGITATRKGLTKQQKKQLRRLLKWALYNHEPWLLHGDCLGGDADAHQEAKTLGYKIRIFPPLNGKLRAYLPGDVIENQQLYSIRNQNIVNECDYLIALPGTMHEHQRSGTWSTLRFARLRKKPHTIIYPDGTLDGSNWWKVLK